MSNSLAFISGLALSAFFGIHTSDEARAVTFLVAVAAMAASVVLVLSGLQP